MWYNVACIERQVGHVYCLTTPSLKNQTIQQSHKPQEIKLYTNQTKPDLSFRLWIPINRLSLQLIDNLLLHEAPTSNGQKLGSTKCQKSLWDQWVHATSMRSTPAGGQKCVSPQAAAAAADMFHFIFVFFWGLRGQILGALGSVYIALLVS